MHNLAEVSPPDYTDADAKRAMFEASILEPITRGMLQRAGLSRGMRVLDLGCGIGDVSFLAAEMVGPSGTVIGVDNNPAALAMAEDRRAKLGYRQVSFQLAALEHLPLSARFDAVIGRHILMHLHAPVPVLRNVTRLVRPGGIVAFQELAARMPRLVYSMPTVPLWHASWQWIADAVASTGAQLDVGGRLWHVFALADLPRPHLTCQSPIGGGIDSPFYPWVAETVRGLVQRILSLGIATEEEIEIDTLEERLRDGATAADSQLVAPAQFCAWTRVPSHVRHVL